jgi:hypothetical protein
LKTKIVATPRLLKVCNSFSILVLKANGNPPSAPKSAMDWNSARKSTVPSPHRRAHSNKLGNFTTSNRLTMKVCNSFSILVLKANGNPPSAPKSASRVDWFTRCWLLTFYLHD